MKGPGPMKAWAPYGMKIVFIALAILMDRWGLLSPAVANMLLTAMLGTAGAAMINAYANRPLGPPQVAAALAAAKSAVASPQGAMAALEAVEKAVAAAKAAAAPATPPAGGAS